MILVTGATGFIGRHLVERLLAENYPVRCLIPENKVQHLPWERDPEIVVGTILDEEALFRAATGAHVVIHLENAQWWGRPRDLERIELTGNAQPDHGGSRGSRGTNYYTQSSWSVTSSRLPTAAL